MDKQDVSRQMASRRPQAGALEDQQALAVQAIEFTIEPANSKVSLSATLKTPAGSFDVIEQGVGSLTTSFSGKIGTLVDFAASSIVFREAGTSLDAAVSGDWSPRPGGIVGTAPADYGGKFVSSFGKVFVAIHDMTATLATGARLSQSGSTWTFSFGQQLRFTVGTVDYLSEGLVASAVGSGSLPLPNRAAANTATAGAGQIEDLGSGKYRLTVPIMVSITSDVGSGSTLTLRAQGVFVATAIVPPVLTSTS